MNARDERSVGELLLDADFTTRQVLMDAAGQDASSMLRTWGEVVQSASELWASLPQPAGGPASSIDGVTMARLESMSQLMHRTQVRRGWPGDGPGDEGLLHVAETFTRAADLIDRRGGHIGPTDPAVRADLDAARMRILHTLYVGAHSVGVAVGLHVCDVELSTRGMSSRESRAVPRGQDAINRLAAFEQLAGAYVGNQFARAAQGEHVRGPYGTERLQQALIGWDIQATACWPPPPPRPICSWPAEPRPASPLLKPRSCTPAPTPAMSTRTRTSTGSPPPSTPPSRPGPRSPPGGPR